MNPVQITDLDSAGACFLVVGFRDLGSDPFRGQMRCEAATNLSSTMVHDQ
jgi:hypothetical protein